MMGPQTPTLRALCAPGRVARPRSRRVLPRAAMAALQEPAEAAALADEAAGEGGAAGAGEGVVVLDPLDVSADGARHACPAPGCGRVFKSRSYLLVHQRRHGPGDAAAAAAAPSSAKFHCFVEGCAYGVGGKTLATKKSAVQHFNQRHAAKVHFCSRPSCGASFAKAHQLNRHVQNAHSSFKCRCQVSFGSRHALNKHVKHFNAQPGVAPDTHAPAHGAEPGDAPAGAAAGDGDEAGDGGAAAHAAPEPPSALL